MEPIAEVGLSFEDAVSRYQPLQESAKINVCVLFSDLDEAESKDDSVAPTVL